ncbi:MAG: RdgB/HAM1 family non-canonical purine NTP pyrophosphatase [Clostridia bacterium]|nr:RdgB/HAM1 family non-canonical purine NTP pyrophosphatase [Clostridia bacterium]
MRFIIATHNAHKLEELRRILQPLGIEAVTDRDLGIELPEVDETGTTFAENAYLKAAAACAFSGLPAIADDSGLMVDALDGAPGVYSARYAGENGTDAMCNEKLLFEMRDIPDEKRGAQFVSAICCVFPSGDTLTANGICRGTIGYAPKGENGFGYDPLFITEDFPGKTSAEISSAEKDAISHRGKALRVFATLLQDFLKKQGEN